jgi:methyl-accepting chemotaxis protein
MLEHVAAAVGDVRRQSEDVIAYAEGELTAEAIRDRAIRVEDLQERHVMGRQRTTHASSTGGETAQQAAEPVIELF